jgi:hypothetical protein
MLSIIRLQLVSDEPRLITAQGEVQRTSFPAIMYLKTYQHLAVNSHDATTCVIFKQEHCRIQTLVYQPPFLWRLLYKHATPSANAVKIYSSDTSSNL